MVACTSDTEPTAVPQDSDSDVLQLIPFMRPNEEMTTRATVIPDGYKPFTEVYKIPDGTTSLSFGIFMAEEGITPPTKMGQIKYQGITKRIIFSFFILLFTSHFYINVSSYLEHPDKMSTVPYQTVFWYTDYNNLQ